MSNGRDYFRVEQPPGYARSLIALYRFYPEYQKGHPERGPFAYRWIPASTDLDVEKLLVQLRLDGFKELPNGEVDATPVE